ncbi:MAG TPA: DNA repair protein RecO [Cytophagales bacterium]|nr:DNA repair protein RecO [Cytophagales bacterium]
MANTLTTRAVIFQYIKYRDTSIIVRTYTEQQGAQSYVVNGVRKAKARYPIGLFQPLALVEIVGYHSKGRDLHRLKEIKHLVPYQSIPFSPKKSGIALFLTELFQELFREEPENEPLFAFLWEGCQVLDTLSSVYENYHLQLLLKIARFSGIGVVSAEEMFAQMHHLPPDPHIAQEEKAIINRLLKEPFGSNIPLNGRLRSNILENLLDFYRAHLDHLRELKSLEVLREIMR